MIFFTCQGLYLYMKCGYVNSILLCQMILQAKCEICITFTFQRYQHRKLQHSLTVEEDFTSCIYCIVETLAIAISNCLWLDITDTWWGQHNVHTKTRFTINRIISITIHFSSVQDGLPNKQPVNK